MNKEANGNYLRAEPIVFLAALRWHNAKGYEAESVVSSAVQPTIDQKSQFSTLMGSGVA
jgi:hypothetical protein